MGGYSKTSDMSVAKASRRARPILLTLLLVASVASAGASNPEEIVNGCRNLQSGALRIVDSAEECRAKEEYVAWNVRGPTGPEGPTGPRGEPGPQGPPGPSDLTALSGSPCMVGDAEGSVGVAIDAEGRVHFFCVAGDIDAFSQYLDRDGDGFGDDSTSQTAPVLLSGYVLGPGDCDDDDAQVRPGAFDLHNGVDDDCDGELDEGGDATLELEPATQVARAGDVHEFAATLTNADGSAVVGAPILFEVWRDHQPSDGTFVRIPHAMSTQATGEDSVARFAYVSTTAGLDAIVACYDEDGDEACTGSGVSAADPSAGAVTHTIDGDHVLEIEATATVVWEPGADRVLTIVGTATAVLSVGQSHTVAAQVTDEFGNPVAGEDVSFQVWRDADGPPDLFSPAAEGGTFLTDGQGLVTLEYVSTASGLDAIIACLDQDEDGECTDGSFDVSADETTGNVDFVQDAGDLEYAPDTATARWLPDAPGMLVLETSSPEPSAGSPVTLSAFVFDRFGNPTSPGTEILFEVYRDHENDGVFDVLLLRHVASTGSTGVASNEATFVHEGDAPGAADAVVACIDGPDDDGCAALSGGAVIIDPDDFADVVNVRWN